MKKTFQERIAYALSISTDTRVFEMGRGCASMTPDVFKKCFPGRKAMIVADIHTWPVLGEKVFALLTQAGVGTEKYIIEKEVFHAEWKYVEMVD